MPLRRISSRPLVSVGDIAPSRPDFEVVGTFNPGAVQFGDEVILLVRVAERPKDRKVGLTGLPRWDPKVGLTVDWIPDSEIDVVDPRVVRRKSDGLVRITFISHLRVVFCGDGRAVREISEAGLFPSHPLEEFGVEDPRITPIEGRYWITYVAVSQHGPATALAWTVDFQKFHRCGLIFCPENKDVVLFPHQVGGKYHAIHRPVCGTPFTRPEMWVASSTDLIGWGEHRPVVLDFDDWQSGRVGAGTPPIKTDDGWLEIYHGNQRPTAPGEVGAYFGGALLLDPDEPSRVLGRSLEPILVPETDFECEGFVPNVVFPTGVVEDGERLLVYYGAADSVSAVVELSRSELLGSLSVPHDG